MTETTHTYRSPMPVAADHLYAWHANPGVLQRLTPPWLDVRIEEEGGIADGDTAQLRVPVAGPLGFTWELEHESLPDGLGFADIQRSGPFRSWRHEHRFEAGDAGSSVLVDCLTYGLPFGAAGETLAGGRLERTLDELFAFRHRRTRLDLTRHGTVNQGPLHVAITGATGLVGAQLVAFLQTGGHTVSRIVRKSTGADDEMLWDPARGEIDAQAIEGLDAVVHMAGASIGSWPWSQKRKAAIRDSRVNGTKLLARTLSGLQRPPAVLVSTSAVGYYGSRGDEVLSETSPSGSGFLADVCRDWEAAAQPAAAAGIRVVHPRFGVVLAGEGGMLPLVAKVVRAGIGGPLGNGRQYLAWIALDDLLGIILEAILNPALEGPVNAVAPQAITNAEFTRALGTVLHRPTIVPAPAFAIRAVTGELADNVILTSQRVEPSRLQSHGFRFAFPTIDTALRHELGRSAGHAEVDAAATGIQPSPDTFRTRDAA
jgi:uncharacterized protein (TIGR01777 family)